MAGERVTVTVDDGHLAQVREVAEALRRRGMRVESVLEGLGMVTGEADDPGSLREVEGVQSVDAQMRHDIGPPGANIQDLPPPRHHGRTVEPHDASHPGAEEPHPCTGDPPGDDTGRVERGRIQLPPPQDDVQ